MVYLKGIVGEKPKKDGEKPENESLLQKIQVAENLRWSLCKPFCRKLKMEKTLEPLNILLKILQLYCILLNMNLHSEIILSKIEVEMQRLTHYTKNKIPNSYFSSNS